MVAHDSYLKAQRNRHLEELKAFLRFATVSTLPDHQPHIQACASWVAAALRQIGLEHVALLPTGGNPIAYGDWLHAGPDRPLAIVYGHYDVQPVDPLELWESPPFEPTIRDGKIYARGASDNKGQIFTHLKALEAMLAVDGGLPCNVKVLVEGEEELRADHLTDFLSSNRELVRGDVVVNSDAHLFARGVPSVTTGVRGMAALHLTLRGARTDLHSGVHGGTVPNALHAIVTLLGTLHSPADGRVLVEGFYDKVRPPTSAERAEWAHLPFDAEEYRRSLGLPQLFGEAGFTPIERTWARPTLELHGVWGGFQGEGIKTVIPCTAHAKLSCRLVPDQDPVEILGLLRQHLERHTPPGTTLTIDFEMPGAWPVLTPREHPAVQAALAALREAYGVEPVVARSGGSVPVVELCKRLLNLDSVLLGFGLPSDRFHAPNEHFHLENFDRGLRTLLRFWPRLAAAMRR